MVTFERPPDPRLLTASNWRPHWIKDGCDLSVTPKPPQLSTETLLFADHVRDSLKDRTTGRNVDYIVAGEADFSGYPLGSVVIRQTERLQLAKIPGRRERIGTYAHPTQLGVLVDSEEEGVGKQIVFYTSNQRASENTRVITGSRLVIGEVMHTRGTVRGHPSDDFERVLQAAYVFTYKAPTRPRLGGWWRSRRA